jgi:hypothetical protein
MDIEEFYAADERRRHSAELEFGRDWTDAGLRCEVSWVEDTGELYLMREPDATVLGDTFGDMKVMQVSEHDLGVELLGVIEGRDAISAVMSGWEQQMLKPDGVAWLRDRIDTADEHLGDAPAQPSEELPEDD